MGWWCLSLVVFLAGCASGPPPNVVVVVIDTLRADRVGWYRGGRELTPFLDRLAERGTVFWSAYAQSSWTCPSVASLLTSRYQSQHNVVAHASVLAAEEITLAETLKAHGYATGAFIANRVLSARLGYAQGFDEYRVFPSDLSAGDAAEMAKLMVKGEAEALNQAALAWIDSLRRPGEPPPPAFVYLQYMEPHWPYTAPMAIVEKMVARHDDPARRRQILDRVMLAQIRPTDPNPWTEPTADELVAIEDLYDAEVRHLDDRLAELFAELDRRGFLANAVVAITSDHGDEFEDHGGLGHGTTLYDELIRVPLLLVGPATSARVDVADVVSLVDLAPTILAQAGIAVPPSFAGVSLAGTTSWPRRQLDRLWRVLGLGGRSAYSQLLEPLGKPLPKQQDEALVAGADKLIGFEDGTEVFYDLQADPGERHPVVPSAAVAADLRRTLERERRRASRDPAAAATQALDAETKERLRALGYE